MVLRVALQMDPISGIDIRGDTSFALALEAQKRGHELFYYEPDRLVLRDGDVSAAIQGFYLPKRFSLPLGHKIERFRIKLQVLGQLKRPIDRETLTAWRDDGGTIEISALEARYGSLQMVASGTMALDHQLQPLAAMSVKLQGYVTALDQLRAARVIGAREVAIAKLVLGALSRRELDGGPAAVRLPFNTRNGFLTAQGIKLFAIPPVVWPGKAAKVQ